MLVHIIADYGGDPNQITIAGESAESVSVSALMVSPLANNLIAGAIGSSGSLMGTLSPIPLAKAEHNGMMFASSIGATSLATASPATASGNGAICTARAVKPRCIATSIPIHVHR